ncbi:hypothetical protein [Streptomyces sp. NPDC051704]|uniref:hypothetical protein n=1 Tax=Streptomyces sp. NPDC051704 TaxID=3365671 RepID=UPI0037AEDBF8
MTYWDPIPTVRAMAGEPHPLWQGDRVSRDWSGPAPDGWERRDWRERGRVRVREWATGVGWGPGATSDPAGLLDAAEGARAYVAHIDGDLADQLRGYVFRLAEGRPARPGEALPAL